MPVCGGRRLSPAPGAGRPAAFFSMRARAGRAVSPPIAPLSAGDLDSGPHPAAEEESDARAMRAPIRPTPAMLEQHNVSHLPFRSW